MIKGTDITKIIIEESIMFLWRIKHINTKCDYITDDKPRRDTNNTTNTKQ